MPSGASTTRGFSWPGQLTKAATRTPPSRRLPLPPLNGALDAGGFWSCWMPPSSESRSSLLLAPCAKSPLVAPPLSLAKRMIVLSRSPFLSSSATMRPTWTSSSVIIAA